MKTAAQLLADSPFGRACPSCNAQMGAPCRGGTEIHLDRLGWNMRAYQLETGRTELKTTSDDLIVKNAIGLAEEAGECAGLIKKWRFHGRELSREKLAEELGDVLWYVSQLASAANIELEYVAAKNAAKLRARYPDGYSHEACAERADEKAT